MFQASRASLPYYIRFIERYASLGYAILYSETGDFYESQARLERALAEGYPVWAARVGSKRDTEETLRRILRRVSSSGGIGDHPLLQPPSAFDKSGRVQELRQAEGVLRSFPATVMIAIFLEVVEESPRDVVGRLLGKPPEFFEEIHQDLDQRIAKWRPDDPAAREFFARLLRQFRLAPTFLATAQSRMDYSWKSNFNLMAAGRNALIAVGVVLLIAVGTNPRGWPGQESPWEWFGIMAVGSGTHLLWIDLMLWAAVGALKRGMRRHEGEGMALSGEYEHPLVNLSAVQSFAVLMVTAGVMFYVKPNAFRTEWLSLGYLLGHVLFIPLASAAIIRVFFRIIMDRDDRRTT